MKFYKLAAVTMFAAILSSAAITNASIYTYTTNLDGLSEVPPNASPGIGSVTLVYDNVLHTLGFNVSFSGLTGTTTASHIHASTLLPFTSTAGVAITPGTLPGFPLGVTSGTYLTTLDLTLSGTYTSGFLTANGGTPAGAEAGIFNAFNTGKAYFNIHTATFPGGEIRGFLVPEPTSMALVALGGLGLIRRKRSKPTAK